MLKMFDENDDYELDRNGNRVLIGLSIEETDEFFRLDEAIRTAGPRADILRDDFHSPDERRWLELFEKHTIAKLPFSRAGKTKH